MNFELNESFLAGFVCAVILNCLSHFFFGFFGRMLKEMKTRKRLREMQKGERCGGGFKGCPGGLHCTSSHK